ncbi:HAD family hydrolase [Gorillibacterium massiliense]|uniref:HAD family hydrolase n=1 Tax=Gorillibacterium massiliense TaxID=1280390 RepID=UPI0004B35AA9|nr:HAD family hydrolase [Gorillibacterium massiliense]
MTPQTILFDMDDTLSHCNIYFDMVLEQFCDQMTTWFAGFQISAEDIKKKQYDLDTLGVTQLGFTEDHFPHSLVETYRYFCQMTGRLPDDLEIDSLLQLGKSVYNREVEPYPYMEETLIRLQSEGHHLYLYTGGVEVIQKRKVESLRLGRFFGDRIFIRQRKETAALEMILQENGFDRGVSWMVGNSLRTDILPALETGIKAIYVPAIREWDYNIVDVSAQPKDSFFTVPALKDVPDMINNFTAEKNRKLVVDR